MAATAVWMLAFLAQDNVLLEVGKPIEGRVGVDSAVTHTPTLDANYSNAPTVGRGYQVMVAKTGPYTIELRSYEFDAYLVVTGFDGTVLVEDDDGLLNTHARVVLELEADHKYMVQACALHGERGQFQLNLFAGTPAPPSQQDQLLAEEDDLKARLVHIELTLGKETEEYAVFQHRLGLHYFEQGDYKKAQFEWENALEIRESVLGPEHPDTSLSLNNLAFLLNSQGNYERARPLYERELAIQEKVLGPEHPETALSLNNLAGLLRAQGNYEESRQLYERALAIREKFLGPEHPDTAVSLNNLAFLLQAQGSYEEAQSLYERSLAIREKVLGPEHPDTALSLNNLALLFSSQGNYAEARLLYERSLSIWEKVLGPEHPDIATGIHNLSLLHYSQGNYREARPLLERALAIRKKVLGPEHPDTAQSLNNLAVILQTQGNYEGARPLYERALAIREKVLGPEHPDSAQSLNNLAFLLNAQGNYREASPLYERSLAILEKVLGPEHPDTAQSLNNLAALLKSQGNYEAARPLYERALAILEEVFGPGHPDTATSLTNLAALLQSQGNHEDARTLYERALAIYEQALGPEHPVTAQSLNSLAALLESQGSYREARLLNERALAILEKVHGPDHPGTASSLNSLAVHLLTQGNHEEARPLFERALAIRENVLGPEHPVTAASLNNLAGLLHTQGNHVEARQLYERVLAIKKKVLGPEHPDTAASLINLAHHLNSQGHHEEAQPLFLQALSSSLEHLDRELRTMSESGRLRLLEISASPGIFLPSLCQDEPSSLMAPYALFQKWKGKATRIQAASLQLGQADKSPVVRGKKGQIQVLAKELSGLILLPLADQTEDHSHRIDSIRAERIRLERELNRELGLDLTLATPSLKEVQAGLPADAVLLDFFVGQEVYAWALKSFGEPELISLGARAALRDAQNAFLGTTAERGGRTMAQEGADPRSEIMEVLWKPLREAVGDASTVFVSPDGFLCELPFGVLRQENGSFLLEKHRFIYLTDPTRLAKLGQVPADAEGTILAIGGVNYFRRDDVPGNTEATSSARSLVGNSWESLPATRGELQTLRDLHEFVLEWEAPLTVVEGQAATEERVRGEFKGHRYLHIATHGYFEPGHLPSLLLDAEEKHAKAELGEQIQAVGLLPGLLSGLVFAGVNGEPDPTRDDGYLSAEEIQHLDLSACDMVVLSACETALGSARAGEGLMSLRRAFSVAGADTVVSSLWKVDDQATATLMKDFYTNLWQKGLSRGEALHQAKLRMLRRNRIDHDGDAMPSTWGAFVLSGAWN